MTGAGERPANLLQVTPFVHVPDLERALAFFAALGFRPLFRTGDYAYVHRERIGFRLLEARGAAVPATGARRYAYYVDVRDVDALHAELKPALDLLPAGDVEGPKNREYGQRELLVTAPDGQLLVFGQALAQE
jgi:catechol 2,3-dioxygenase-like lactoylglutathione lyase family enzyme